MHKKIFCSPYYYQKPRIEKENPSMAGRIGQDTIVLNAPVGIEYSCGIAGSKEREGPLGNYFDIAFHDDKLGQDTWEKAESTLQTTAVRTLLKKSGLITEDIDIIFAGDLLNQCISSTFGLRELNIPLYGQYGACSTMAQAIAMSAIFVESGAAGRAVAVTSSHFCSAERQFRLPIEYGGQRTPSAQWTVTGAGAALIETGGKILIRHITPGRMVDLSVKDAANMGAAMAPAAADTIARYLADTQTKPSDYDLILTGDLGKIGSVLLCQLLQRQDIDITKNHQDCGCMIYDIEGQDVHAGGSGCGCCASVFCSYIMQRMQKQELNNILFVATGALMSPTSSQQGESIPAIAHLIHLTGAQALHC